MEPFEIAAAPAREERRACRPCWGVAVLGTAVCTLVARASFSAGLTGALFAAPSTGGPARLRAGQVAPIHNGLLVPRAVSPLAYAIPPESAWQDEGGEDDDRSGDRQSEPQWNMRLINQMLMNEAFDSWQMRIPLEKAVAAPAPQRAYACSAREMEKLRVESGEKSLYGLYRAEGLVSAIAGAEVLGSTVAVTNLVLEPQELARGTGRAVREVEERLRDIAGTIGRDLDLSALKDASCYYLASAPADSPELADSEVASYLDGLLARDVPAREDAELLETDEGRYTGEATEKKKPRLKRLAKWLFRRNDQTGGEVPEDADEEDGASPSAALDQLEAVDEDAELEPHELDLPPAEDEEPHELDLPPASAVPFAPGAKYEPHELDLPPSADEEEPHELDLPPAVTRADAVDSAAPWDAVMNAQTGQDSSDDEATRDPEEDVISRLTRLARAQRPDDEAARDAEEEEEDVILPPANAAFWEFNAPMAEPQEPQEFDLGVDISDIFADDWTPSSISDEKYEPHELDLPPAPPAPPAPPEEETSPAPRGSADDYEQEWYDENYEKDMEEVLRNAEDAKPPPGSAIWGFREDMSKYGRRGGGGPTPNWSPEPEYQPQRQRVKTKTRTGYDD